MSVAAPLLFEPIFKERVWGGRRLADALGKKLPPEKRIGESWEIVDRPEAQSVVKLGPLRGRTLHQLWTEQRADVFGDVSESERFPILAKLLDAREKLSLQVHPGADVARSLGGEPKSELWHFLAADPGAEIFAGLRRGVPRKEFETALQNGQVADLVHRVEVKTGDVFFIPSGRLHAIGAGNLIVEIQQNSDTTYRVFDWNRPAENDKPRQLHLDAALRAIDFNDFEPAVIHPTGERLLDCPYFAVDQWELRGPRTAAEHAAFALFVCLSGSLTVNGVAIGAGDFFLIPASEAATKLEPAGAGTSVLRVTAPIR